MSLPRDGHRVSILLETPSMGPDHVKLEYAFPAWLSFLIISQLQNTPFQNHGGGLACAGQSGQCHAAVLGGIANIATSQGSLEDCAWDRHTPQHYQLHTYAVCACAYSLVSTRALDKG